MSISRYDQMLLTVILNRGNLKLEDLLPETVTLLTIAPMPDFLDMTLGAELGDTCKSKRKHIVRHMIYIWVECSALRRKSMWVKYDAFRIVIP